MSLSPSTTVKINYPYPHPLSALNVYERLARGLLIHARKHRDILGQRPSITTEVSVIKREVSPYLDNPSNLQVEHTGYIWAGIGYKYHTIYESPYTPDEVKELLELGWILDEQEDCFKFKL